MKRIHTINLLVFLIIISCEAFSQIKEVHYKVRGQEIMMSWDVVRLTNEKSFNVIIPEYHLKMGVNSEDDSIYIKRKVTELNSKKVGKGDDWLKEWNISKSYFLPIFIEGYNDNASKQFMPKLFTNENNNSQSNAELVLQPTATSFIGLGCPTVLMHADIVSIKEPFDTIARMNFFTYVGGNLSKKYPGYIPADFYMAGQMMAKFFEKYVYKPK